jgi:hypothetical protein
MATGQSKVNVSYGDSELLMSARLKLIANAVAAKQSSSEAKVRTKTARAPFTCSMDPAERALCDSCQ